MNSRVVKRQKKKAVSEEASQSKSNNGIDTELKFHSSTRSNKMSQKTDGGGDENSSATRINFGTKFSCNGVQQHDHTHAHEGTTNTPLIMKSVDSLLEGFQDSKSSIKPFPSHMKHKVLENLRKLELDFTNIHLLRSLSALLKEVSFSLPKHLRLTLSGLEQTLVAGRSQLLDSVADKNATFIEPEEGASGNANLIASKKRVLSVSCSCDALRADIADINATIENLMAKKANLEKLLAINLPKGLPRKSPDLSYK